MVNFIPAIYIPVDAIAPVSLFALCMSNNAIFQPTYGRVLFTSYHCQEFF